MGWPIVFGVIAVMKIRILSASCDNPWNDPKLCNSCSLGQSMDVEFLYFSTLSLSSTQASQIIHVLFNEYFTDKFYCTSCTLQKVSYIVLLIDHIVLVALLLPQFFSYLVILLLIWSL